MSYFILFCLAMVSTSISAVVPTPTPAQEPKPNPVFETVNPPNTSVSDIPKTN